MADIKPFTLPSTPNNRFSQPTTAKPTGKVGVLQPDDLLPLQESINRLDTDLNKNKERQTQTEIAFIDFKDVVTRRLDQLANIIESNNNLLLQTISQKMDVNSIKKNSKYGDYKLYSHDPVLHQELLEHCQKFLDKLYKERPGQLINSVEIYDLFNEYLIENKYNKIDHRLAKELMLSCGAEYGRKNRKIYILIPGRVLATKTV